MRRINILISFALLAGLGYSQCTGGLFAMPYAIAAGADVQDEALLMSIAPIECEVAGQSRETNNDLAKTSNGCSDGDSCLEQAHLNIIQSASLKEGGGTAQEILPSTIALVFDTETSHGISEYLARAGPLYAMARISADVLVKKE